MSDCIIFVFKYTDFDSIDLGVDVAKKTKAKTNKIEIKCKYDKLMSIYQLNKMKHPDNPNKHSPEQVDRLIELFRYQGIRLPIILSKNSNLIVSGHGRLEAAEKADMENYPVVFQQFDDDSQEYAFLTSDNAIHEWSFLDRLQIQIDLPKYNLPSISLLGFKNFEIPKVDVKIENKKVEFEARPNEYIVAVICKSEMAMNEVFSELKNRGYQCKLIT